MNNYEKIKNMSIDEMAGVMCNSFGYFTGGCEKCPFFDCDRGKENPFKQWLQKECEE